MMDQGFHHPDLGYWQVDGAVSQEILDGYPPGTVAVTVRPTPEYEWTGNEWQSTKPNIAAVRTQASSTMLQRIEVFTAQFTAKYPSAEVASWGTQAAEANAVIDGGKSVVIAAFAETRGVSEMEMAQRIAEKSAVYMSIIGKVAGLRDATFDALELAETPEQIQSVLDAAMAKAQGMAKVMGLEF